MLPGPGSCPSQKSLGLGTEGASGSRFLTPAGRVQGLGRKVLPCPGSYPSWKGSGSVTECASGSTFLTPDGWGLGFGTEGASGSRFLPDGFRVWGGRCFWVPVLTGWVSGLGLKVLLGPGSYPSRKGLGFGTEGVSCCK